MLGELYRRQARGSSARSGRVTLGSRRAGHRLRHHGRRPGRQAAPPRRAAGGASRAPPPASGGSVRAAPSAPGGQYSLLLRRPRLRAGQYTPPPPGRVRSSAAPAGRPVRAASARAAAAAPPQPPQQQGGRSRCGQEHAFGLAPPSTARRPGTCASTSTGPHGRERPGVPRQAPPRLRPRPGPVLPLGAPGRPQGHHPRARRHGALDRPPYIKLDKDDPHRGDRDR